MGLRVLATSLLLILDDFVRVKPLFGVGCDVYDDGYLFVTYDLH